MVAYGADLSLICRVDMKKWKASERTTTNIIYSGWNNSMESKNHSWHRATIAGWVYYRFYYNKSITLGGACLLSKGACDREASHLLSLALGYMSQLPVLTWKTALSNHCYVYSTKEHATPLHSLLPGCIYTKKKNFDELLWCLLSICC